ncbi:TyeA family type III secretion system gatekeeper subunit [bacterium]|nr:TyeA family type III secretion system gatekeeper subunit [bacterium]
MQMYSEKTAQLAHLLMKEILSLKDQRFIDSSKITAIVDRCKIENLEARIYFLRELHSLIRKMPLKLFVDDQARLRLLTAIQEALDIAIDKEEEEFE